MLTGMLNKLKIFMRDIIDGPGAATSVDSGKVVTVNADGSLSYETPSPAVRSIIKVTADLDLSSTGIVNGAVYHCNTTGGDINITLPDTSTDNDGVQATFLNETGANSVIIETIGGQNIGDSPLQTIQEDDKSIAPLSDNNDGHYHIIQDSRTDPQPTSFLFLMASDVSGDVGGYRTLDEDLTEGVSTDIATAGLSAGTTELEQWVTDPGIPDITEISQGVISVHIHAKQDNAVKDTIIFAEIYKRASGGTETLLFTTANSSILPATSTALTLDAIVSVDTPLLTTDRLVVKVSATLVGAGSRTVTLEVEGVTASRISVPGPAVVLPNASTTVSGKTRYSTNAEAVTGTEAAAANTPASLTARLEAPGAIGGTTPATSVDTDFLNLNGDADFNGNYALQLQNISDLASKGPGYWFDGIDDNGVQILADGSEITSYPFTLVALVRPDVDLSDVADVLSLTVVGLDNVNYGIGITSNGFPLITARNTDQKDGISSIDIRGKWSVIIGVFASETSRKLYINGVEDNESTDSVLFHAQIDQASVGYRADNTPSAYLLGTVAKGYFFNRAFTTAEAKAFSSSIAVPNKYIGANSILVVPSDDCDDDDTANWTDVNGALTDNGTEYTFTVTTGASAASFTDEAALTIGKRYRATVLAKDGTAAGATVRINALTNGDAVIENGASITVVAGFGKASVEWTATETDNKVQIEIVAGSLSDGETVLFDEIEINAIGAVIQFEQDSITEDKWYDKSGNALDGTVTGATAINLPAASQVDNILIDGNTISSTNTNGDINLDPNGSGFITFKFGSVVNHELRFSGGIDAVISNAGPSQIYVTGDGGAAPFNAQGNLIIQPRTSAASRHLFFYTGNGTPLPRMKIRSTGEIDMLSGAVTIGVADTTPGIITIAGNTTSNADGGKVVLDTAADHDATINAYVIQANQDDLLFGPNTDTTSFRYNGGPGTWQFAGANGVIIDNSLTSTGIYGTDVNGGSSILAMSMSNDGKIGHDSSTIRGKIEIKDLQGSERIYDLHPVIYRPKKRRDIEVMVDVLVDVTSQVEITKEEALESYTEEVREVILEDDIQFFDSMEPEFVQIPKVKRTVIERSLNDQGEVTEKEIPEYEYKITEITKWRLKPGCSYDGENNIFLKEVITQETQQQAQKSWEYIDEAGGDGVNQFGLIAEEVIEHIPELVFKNADGSVAGVHYDRMLVTMMLAEIQKLNERIKILE